jgi:hypothetical protein
MSAARARALAFALLCASGGARAADRTVETAAGGCTVALVERGNEPALQLRPGCALDLGETLRATGALLVQLYPDQRIPPEVKSLSLGRIEALPWLSERVAEAARSDPAWNAKTGRPNAGSAEAWVADALRRHGLARELLRLLAAYGVAAEPSSVEKVLVRTGADARLPFDAVVWLRLSAP